MASSSTSGIATAVSSTGAQVARERDRVASVGLDAHTAGDGDLADRDDLAAPTPAARSSRASAKPLGPAS